MEGDRGHAAEMAGESLHQHGSVILIGPKFGSFYDEENMKKQLSSEEEAKTT